MRVRSLRGVCYLLPPVFLALAGVAVPAPQGSNGATPAPMPPMRVDYQRDVKPLLVARCYACHGNGQRLGDFQIDSRDGVLKGGKTHPAVVPGHSDRSLL